MAATVKTTVLDGKKYQMILLPKGTKAPQGDKTLQLDGENYILSPIEPTPAKTAEVAKGPESGIKSEEKAPEPKEEKKSFPSEWWHWVLFGAGVIFLVIIMAWMIKGLFVNNNGTAAQGNTSQPAVSAPAASDSNAAPATTSSDDKTVVNTVVSEETVVDMGSIGAYHAVYDSNLSKWTLGVWETSALPDRSGTGLSEFKLKATSVSFVMPADGEINNSAGHIAINNIPWTLGNPAKDSTGNTIVKKGDSVTIWTDGPNDSAGFQLWFQ